MQFFGEIEMTQEQANAIARAMLTVARAEGGADERELAVIREFHGAGVESLPDLSPAEAANVVPAGEAAQLLVKSCFLVAWADNDCGAAERAVIDSYAAALGLSKDDASHLEQGVKEFLLSQLSRLANTDAVVAVARKLQV